MSAHIRTLHIDTSALPNEPVYGKLFPILKKRIEDRCGTVCTGKGTADFILTFALDSELPAEAFCLSDCDGGIRITGADFLSLMYGAGQFLHKSRYTTEGILPTAWRGLSKPQNEKRMVFFAQHFYNWYHVSTEEEIREHIEDLTLWGMGGVVSVFSCLNVNGWDDPETAQMANLFRKTLKAAKELQLKTGMEFSNIDFKTPRKDVAADYRHLISTTGNLICPSTEAGYAYYEEMLGNVLKVSEDIGLDFITLWSYDEGGCGCDKCWPWGGNGFYRMAHRASKFIKSRYPHMEIWLATWYFGRSEAQKDEWPLLYKHLQEDAAKGDNWCDYLLLETRDDFDDVFYPARHGQPTAHTKLLTFPDVSMVGLNPWGAFGAACTPELMKRWEAPFAPHCSGGYLYTEGIFDDINKVVMLGIYWDRSRDVNETLADYCGYELLGVEAKDFIRIVELIEKSHSCTNRMDRKPCPLEWSEQAWEIAERVNSGLTPKQQLAWRWRIVYIRAYLDLVRYRNCAAEGWPLPRQLRGWFRFWRRFMADDPRAQDYLLELIHLYKAQEVEDDEKYNYHWTVRPPMTRGYNIADEARFPANPPLVPPVASH